MNTKLHDRFGYSRVEWDDHEEINFAIGLLKKWILRNPGDNAVLAGTWMEKFKAITPQQNADENEGFLLCNIVLTTQYSAGAITDSQMLASDLAEAELDAQKQWEEPIEEGKSSCTDSSKQHPSKSVDREGEKYC